MSANNPFEAQQSGNAIDADNVNPYAARRSSERLLVGDGQVGDGPWRDGPLLVKLKDKALPPRCVKCNEPTTYFLERSLSWHHPLIYVLVLAGCLPYVFVALIVQQTAKIRVGLCDVHRRKRRKAIAIGWAVSLAGVLLFGFQLTQTQSTDDAAFVTLALVLLLVGPIYGIIGARTVVSERIDKTHVWLVGPCATYLAGLPRWVAPNRNR